MAAYNKRFGISGGVGSQKNLSKFARLSPVLTVVNRHLRQAAGRCTKAWPKTVSFKLPAVLGWLGLNNE